VNAPIAYLDHAASTPMRAEAIEAMTPFLAACFANPSGGHRAAREAKTALEEAREAVAGAIGAAPGEVVFTAGGTEADNLAVEGGARAAAAAGRRGPIVVGAFEHKAVLAAAARLEQEGFDVRRVRATRAGTIDLDALADAIDASTSVVSVMLVNNEVGTIQPFADVERIVRERAPGALLHTDAVQAVPWLDVASATRGADLVSISAHKFGGPKGSGALVVRGDVQLQPLLEGGGQERGRRAGTVNVAGAAATAAAIAATTRDRARDVERVTRMRDRLLAGLMRTVDGLFVNGDPARKVAGSCHVGVPGVEAEVLLVGLDRAGVCAAAGSSCSSGATELSHVLLAMGLSDAEARCSIRLSLGFASTDADVDRALDAVPMAVAQLRRAA
jgi:cysteine desulfurase